MLRNCPYCGSDVEDYRQYNVAEGDNSSDMFISETPTTPPDTAFTEIECIQFRPCSHIVERDDIDEILDALRDLRQLKLELNNATEAERVKSLKEYEIPAQVNTVNQLCDEATVHENPDGEDVY